MSYLSQMAGLAVQNFISAGVGMAVLMAVIRGFSRRSTRGLGNFWVDLYRSVVYILLPLSIVLALILVGQGVVQTFSGHETVTTLEGATQNIARGPAASQVAIKQLGTNGGGFYNSNSAVPFENPTPLSNFLELFAILIIPAALTYTFGKMVGSTRQGWALFTAMFAIFLVGVAIALPSEQHGSQVLRDSGVNLTIEDGSSGGNMADKEQRFGIANTALWAVATTDASNGSVNGGHDALTASGGAVPIVNMFVGEVVFGGVGSGLYGMLLYALLTVFIAGLMVGRTPEYLGKKIETREVKLVVLGILFPMVLTVVLLAVSVTTSQGLASVYNPGPHGFSEAIYAWTSMGNNNGSAFAGYGATNFSTLLGGMTMILVRFVPLIAALAVAGSLGDEEPVACLGGHVPHRRRHLRRRPHRRHRPRQRARDPAEARPGAHRRATGHEALLMLKVLAQSLIAIVVSTVVLGFAYPGAITGVARLAFPDRSTGSVIEVDGKPVGSRLAAQAFDGTQYFHPRPSAVDYDAAGTSSPTSGRRAGSCWPTCEGARARFSRSSVPTTPVSPSVTSPSTPS